MKLSLHRLLMPLVFSCLLAGCGLPVPKAPDSPYAPTPLGSVLQINEPIEVPVGSTRVFVQHGAIRTGFDHYAPNCNLEVRLIDRVSTQSIAAGEYPVVRVQQLQEEVARAAVPLQLATLGPWSDPALHLAQGMDDAGGIMLYEGYHLYLGGDDSNLMRLSCRGAFADASEAQPPSIREIRQALGGLMSLRLPGDG